MSLRSVGKIKDTTVVTIRHPDPKDNLVNPDGTPMTVTIHGPYSKRYKQVMRDQQQRMAESAAGGAINMSQDELDTFTDELMVSCIEDWDMTLDGEERLPFDTDTARAVFDEFPWLKDQVNLAFGNVARFLDKPKKH